jgi:hypothetical protein
MLGFSPLLHNYFEGGVGKTNSGVPLFNISVAQEPPPLKVVLDDGDKEMTQVYLEFRCKSSEEANAMCAIHWKPGSIGGDDQLSWKVPIFVVRIDLLRKYVAYKNAETKRAWGEQITPEVEKQPIRDSVYRRF